MPADRGLAARSECQHPSSPDPTVRDLRWPRRFLERSVEKKYQPSCPSLAVAGAYLPARSSGLAA